METGLTGNYYQDWACEELGKASKIFCMQVSTEHLTHEVLLLQGYRARRNGGGGYGGQPAGGKVQLGSVWEVVSTLAQALTDARDQLVGLMSLQQGGGGGGGNRSSPVRNYSPSAGAAVRNLHRQHAQSHVAFGLRTENRQYGASGRGGRGGPGASGSGHAQCNHPLHRMSPPRRNPTPARVSPKRRQMQMGIHMNGGGNVMHVDSMKGRGSGPPLNICLSNGGGGLKSKPASRSNSPETKRHCIGTQYAALLKEEAYQLRERRLAEESKCNRPKWSRC